MTKLACSVSFFAVLISLLSLVSASSVQVWQGQYFEGTTFKVGTYTFNFTVYDSLTGGNACYSNVTNLTTGIFGDWRTEQENVGLSCNNATKDYFLNVNIEGADQTPRRRLTVFDYLRRDTSDIMAGDLRSENPLKVARGVHYINSLDETLYMSFIQGEEIYSTEVPEGFNHTLFYFKVYNGTNPYGYKVIYFDNNTKKIVMSLSRSVNGRASTFYNMQIIPENRTTDSSINVCNGNYVDCNVNEPDLLVSDDIEAASIYANENITAVNYGLFSYLGSLINRVTKLWIQDIDVSNNINVTNNVTASHFIGDGSLLTGINSNITKEIFFPVVPSDANLGDFRVEGIASGAIWRFNFQVPSDFLSLVSLDVIVIPAGTNAAAPLDLYSDYGKIGETYTQHSESSSATWNLVTNTIYAGNVSAVFANLGAGDFCGLQVDEGVFGFAANYIGVRMKYKPVE